ncbi:hypothetical protein LWI28_015407 [Acer negundo]|uniref:Uncharacterized protein n=1 Tax=Acer negundo TaxID=4023 RepID=A0AAD5I9T4_ACENE|nr:hypothetical protein LWI28_015407 [Acer negundo]
MHLMHGASPTAIYMLIGIGSIMPIDLLHLLHAVKFHWQATSYQKEHLPNSEALAPSQYHRYEYRPQVRQQSFNEMQIFRKRWKNAVEEDKYYQPFNNSFDRLKHHRTADLKDVVAMEKAVENSPL